MYGQIWNNEYHKYYIGFLEICDKFLVATINM